MNQENSENGQCLIILPEELEIMCRCCLNKNGVVNLFRTDYKGTVLNELFMVFCQTESDESDELPQNVCNLCAGFLIQHYMFKEKVQHSQKVLQAALDRQDKAKHEITSESFTDGYEDEIDDDFQTEEIIHIINEEIKPEIDIEYDENLENQNHYDFFEEIEDNKEIKVEEPEETIFFTCSFCNIKFASENVYNHHMDKENELRKDEQCTICEQGVNKCKLKEHLEEHVKNNQLQCKLCNRKFANRWNLSTHFLKHFNKKKQCHICNKVFSRAYALADHIRVHYGDKSFCCDICDKKFVTSHAFKNHIYKHKVINGEISSSTCPVCKKVFTKRSVRAHMDTHEEKKFLCSECGKKFSSSKNLSRHALIHKGIKPYVCSVCNKRFSQSTTLKAHSMKHTNTPKPFLCSECGMRFTRNSFLNYHMKKIHGDKLKANCGVFTCGHCGKVFNHPYRLKLHMESHNSEKPFKCNTCNKSYEFKKSLVVHMKYHSGERFTCDICQRSFLSSGAMKMHQIRGHFKNKQFEQFKEKDDCDRPFECSECPKRFNYKWNLKKHMRVHTGEKPYYCDICYKAFSDSSTVNRHKKCIHGTKEGECINGREEVDSI